MAFFWDVGYAGLQRGGGRFHSQLQFSLGDTPEGDATVVEAGEGVLCNDFGGEGTGAQCAAEYPWAVGESFRFVVTEEVVDGVSVFSLTVTNLQTGAERYIGKLRFGQKSRMDSFAPFVEDFARDAPTCLDQPVRSAAYRRARVRTREGWVPVTAARILMVENSQLADAGFGQDEKIACANYDAHEHPEGLALVIGGTNVRDPHASRHVTIPE